MRVFRPVLLFLFMFSFFMAKGEQPITWYSQDILLKNGVFKNYGFVAEPKEFGVVLNNNTDQTQTYYLKINNPHINRIFVFNTKGDTLFVTGDRFKFNTRPILFWEYIFPFQVNPNQTDSLRFQLHKKGEILSFNTLLITCLLYTSPSPRD